MRHSLALRIGPVSFRIGSAWPHPLDALARLYAGYPEPDEVCDFTVRLEPETPWRRWLRPSVSIAGDYVLEGTKLYLRLSVERFGSPALTYRHRHWKKPGHKVRHASAPSLADIPALARQIASHLQIDVTGSQPTLM